jgi:NAD(P)-dependent dehydrogenase (short-subunit alcohol dehydrogenase family)
MSELHTIPCLPEMLLPTPLVRQRLRDQVAVLVGRGSARERLLALSLAERGAHVALVCPPTLLDYARETRQLVESVGRRCLVVPAQTADLPTNPAVAQLVAAAVQTLGVPDIFIILSL